MPATQSVEPRRTSPPSAGTNRELPVLFHLMDVSRLKSPPAAASMPPLESYPDLKFAEAPLETAIAAPEPLPAANTTLPTPAIEAPACEVPGASVASEPVSETKETTAAEFTSVPTANPDQDTTAQPSVSEGAERAVTATEPVATPRKETERRPARAKAPRGNEWFANQGRYIAIGFVLALIGTIFFARSNRGTTSTAAVQPHAHPGEAGQQVSASESKPATIVGDSPEKSASETNAATPADASPAKLADAAAGEKAPQAELHPPTIPQLVREPVPSNQPDNKALFPWTEQPADRLSMRPDAPTATPVTAPPTQYPVTAASAPLAPSYPTTATPNSNLGAPPQQQPVAQPDYRSPYMPATPANSPPPTSNQSFVPPTGGPGSAYLPSENTARGYRYERTGSGPY